MGFSVVITLLGQNRWVVIETARRDSPIYRWPTAVVEQGLRNLSQDGVLAAVHETWPLTLYDLDTRILNSLGLLFPSLSEKALGFHGVPGAGKTPVARCVAMALSRYWITKFGRVGAMKPSFRQASEFDFFGYKKPCFTNHIITANSYPNKYLIHSVKN